MSDETTLATTIRQYSPAKFRAVLNDGTTRDVPMPAGRKRVAAVIATLGALPWTRLEMLSAANEVLGVLTPAEADAGVATRPQYMTRENELADIMIRMQTAATAGVKEIYGPVLEGHRTLLDLTLARLATMEERMAEALEMMRAAALHVAPAPSGSGSMAEAALLEFVKAAGPDVSRAIASKLGIAIPPLAVPATQIPPTTGGAGGGS